ncbi:hypothetical protein HDV02_004133 [Globomyces sp. JEL0801]|nr:hypothetical protein HDV02_004133 [Globomyces sp. JEL0801]
MPPKSVYNKHYYEKKKKLKEEQRRDQVTTVFLMYCEDGLVTQPQCWKTLINSSEEFYLCLYVGQGCLGNVPNSMLPYLMDSNKCDINSGKPLEGVLQLFYYALENFINLEQCYQITGQTIPIATVEQYLIRGSSMLSFKLDGHVLYYDSSFKTTRKHMEEIMAMEDAIRRLLNPNSITFKKTISSEPCHPDECVLWTLLFKKKGPGLLREVLNTTIVARVPIPHKPYRDLIFKDTQDTRKFIAQVIQKNADTLFVRSVNENVNIYKWIKELCGWNPIVK